MSAIATAENMVLRTVYFPPALDARLRELAFYRDISKGELIRLLVQLALDANVLGGPASFAEDRKTVISPSAGIKKVKIEPARRQRQKVAA